MWGQEECCACAVAVMNAAAGDSRGGLPCDASDLILPAHTLWRYNSQRLPWHRFLTPVPHMRAIRGHSKAAQKTAAQVISRLGRRG